MTEPEALSAARRRLRETADSIAKLLAEDLVGYPERELQRRFVESEVGDKLTDVQLADLRKAARELGNRFAEELRGALAHDEPWLALVHADLALPEDKKSLRGVTAVWQDVAAIDEQVDTLAVMYHLPADDRAPQGYAPPARFIGRLHLPTLVEHYFREVVELRKLNEQSAAFTGEQRKSGRAERWASALPDPE
jgi:hypothetical protein